MSLNHLYGGSIGVLGLWGDTIDNGHKIQFEFDVWGVHIRLTPFKIRKPNGFYMSVDFGGLSIKGLRSREFRGFDELGDNLVWGDSKSGLIMVLFSLLGLIWHLI